MIRVLVILGASGDLTSRYLLPTLANLHARGALPDRFRIVGVARDAWDTERFRRHIASRLERHAAGVAPASRVAITGMLDYLQADVTDHQQMAVVLGSIGEAAACYLALPATVLIPTVRALIGRRLPEGSRIVVEKPFGGDLASARTLNHLLHAAFPEQAIFRVDHFLAKQTVQNILGLRFANRVFEPVWNREHVERVEIIWDETVALEGRAAYYDTAGALRDMIQNHLLQLLCLVGMEPPLSLSERDLRDRKVDLLRAVRRLSPAEVSTATVRARYTAGHVGERPVPAYVEEPGVEPSRGTETFAQVTLWVDNWRWAGVPFVLRSGKALGHSRREIAVHFRPVPHLTFGQDEQPEANVLRLMLDPDRVAFAVNINGPGDFFTLESIALGCELAPQDLPAYGHILLDVLQGNASLSIRDDEAEESWRIVEPILEGWTAGCTRLHDYAAGSQGPLTITATE